MGPSSAMASSIAQSPQIWSCVLNWDGTIEIYKPQDLNIQQLIDRGAYQSWIFGPSLLDENGKAKTSFMTWDYIREPHPRTAIGYMEMQSRTVNHPYRPDHEVQDGIFITEGL